MLLLLPLLRRGALQILGLFCLTNVLFLAPPSAHAQASDTDSDEGLAWHQQLWQTPYQQADEALREENYDRAAQIATDPWQRGTANYARGNYERALMDFSQVDSAEGYYNQGNALMQLERYDEAANVYQEALQRNPELRQAQDNLALAQQLAEQQKQQQQQGQGEGQQEQQQQDGQQQGEQQGEQEGQQQSSAEPGAEGEQPPEQEPEAPQDSAQQPEAEAAEDAAEDETGEDAQQAQPSAEQLSEEQRQQLENWLNRIEDDPAILLQRKMELEARRRGRERLPQGVDKQW